MRTALFQELERRLMDPAFRAARGDVSALLTDDFIEVGSNGHVYDKTAILDAMAAEAAAGAPERVVADLSVRMLATDVALVTYRSRSRGMASLRSSIWKRIDGSWLMAFHQGTRI
jgi:hypothetical protein